MIDNISDEKIKEFQTNTERALRASGNEKLLEEFKNMSYSDLKSKAAGYYSDLEVIHYDNIREELNTAPESGGNTVEDNVNDPEFTDQLGEKTAGYETEKPIENTEMVGEHVENIETKSINQIE